jgi:hypothetical protein
MKPERLDMINEMVADDYEFIKWIVEQIPGLEWIDNVYDSSAISIIKDNSIHIYYLYSKDFITETYPLLLTRAIERINETDPFKIDIFFLDPAGWNWSYKDYMNEKERYVCADRAKEAALLYVKNKNIPIDTTKLKADIRGRDLKTSIIIINKQIKEIAKLKKNHKNAFDYFKSLEKDFFNEGSKIKMELINHVIEIMEHKEK